MNKQSLFEQIVIPMIVGIVVGAFFMVPTPAQTIVELPAPTMSPTPTATPTPIPVEEPVQISIPSLQIDSSVEYVGLDEKGAMDVPKDFSNVAWYTLGAKPGEKGNAVIAGHLDTVTGAPAIFYNLSQLKPGDEIFTQEITGKTYRFAVQRLEWYSRDSFPFQEVFGSTDKKTLNLITCAGIYIHTQRSYNQRLVVYTEMVE